MKFSKEQALEDNSLEINLTPLIDVVFLLLIFFMVSTTFVESPGINVKLPEAAQSSKTTEKKDIIISIKENGNIYFEQEKISFQELNNKIQNVLKDNPLATLFLRADKGTNHGRVVQVMDSARSQGVEKIAIATEALKQ